VTERLYYHDCYQRGFRAKIVDLTEDGRQVYLDKTAFYPTSGGQPFDLGTLGGIAIREIVDEDDRIAHVLESPIHVTDEAGDVEGRIDWARRWDHMQQHTGQHLLSAVMSELFGIPTVSFHMGAVISTIDVGVAKLETKRIEDIEERCAAIVAEARPVTISFEEASSDLALRKASERTGTLRIVSIDSLDRSACGGTHVRSTAEIGPIFLRKLEKIRGNLRLEFVCGGRALRHARADFRALSEISRSLSVPFEETPGLVAAQIERAKHLEKTCQRLASDAAQHEGRELYAATSPDDRGIRRAIQRGIIDDAMRARAQAFVHGPMAVFIAACGDPPSILLAASSDSGIHAGDVLKSALAAARGRGGGNRTLAQGSVPDAAALEQVIAAMLI
jgi:alanyl-tRNA synthetase